jgi:hypothetical protein
MVFVDSQTLVSVRFIRKTAVGPDAAMLCPPRDDRLAAARRLRSAVALELAAGKVWALPIAVQPARGIRRRNGTGSP